MASITLTDYEQKRLENIKRNEEMMASLKLHSKALELSSAGKRRRTETMPNLEKKPRSETPITARRSLRVQGLQPEFRTPHKYLTQPESSLKKTGPLTMKEVYVGSHSDRSFVNAIMDMSSNEKSTEMVGCGDESSLDIQSMVLKPENVSRVMRQNILNLKFFPCPHRTMIVAGNEFGNMVFWDVDCEDEASDGIYRYQPHSTSISGISISPFSLSKVFLSCIGGVIRLMDVERESFDLVYSTDNTITCLSQRQQETESIHFAEGSGLLNVFDTRIGKFSNSWKLHQKRINTIDFNPENANFMATSSTDHTVCIWDLRYMNVDKHNYLKRVEYRKSVHSAYFSPSGRCLAATWGNDEVGILSGVDFMDASTLYITKWNVIGISHFRAIWGWDDSYLFIGNLHKGVDIISTADGNVVTLQSSLMSATPKHFAIHPCKLGTLAGATSWGLIYLWT